MKMSSVPVYTRVLARLNNLAQGRNDLVGVPAGHSYVLRDVRLTNRGSDPHGYSFFIDTGTLTYEFARGTVEPLTTFLLSGSIAVPELELVAISVDSTEFALYMTGYDFLT